jgi:hypothetical protein
MTLVNKGLQSRLKWRILSSEMIVVMLIIAMGLVGCPYNRGHYSDRDREYRNDDRNRDHEHHDRDNGDHDQDHEHHR